MCDSSTLRIIQSDQDDVDLGALKLWGSRDQLDDTGHTLPGLLAECVSVHLDVPPFRCVLYESGTRLLLNRESPHVV